MTEPKHDLDQDSLLNAIGFETPHGYKRLEVRHADITKMATPYDLLVISAFTGDYVATPTSVLGALHRNLGIDVEHLAQDPYLDFRDSLGLWVSQEVDNFHFKQIICVEICGGELALGEIFENIFACIALLDAKGFSNSSVLMPLLGTGDQNLSTEEVAKCLLPSSEKALMNSPHLNSITFVERNVEKGKRIVYAIDTILGRKEIQLPKNELMNSLRHEILSLTSRAVQLHPNSQVLQEILRVFTPTNLRSFEAGVLARRLIEYIVDDLLSKDRVKRGTDLFNRIDYLKNQRVSQWISSYMHILRIFGNEAAHEKPKTRVPQELNQSDFIISLFCVSRVLKFWLDKE